MHWTPPSQHQINNVNNPFRHLTEQQLRNQTQLNERAEGLPQDELLKLFGNLRRGTVLRIHYKSAMTSTKGDGIEVVASNPRSLRGGSIEKITFNQANNPSGVKFFLYKRGSNVSFAVGDMGAVLTSVDVLKESLAEGRYKGPQLYKEITRSGLKLGVVLNTAYFLYDNKEQDDPDFDPAEGDEAGPRIWEVSNVSGSLVPSPGPLAKDYKKRYNKQIVAMIDDAFRKNNIKLSTMKFYTESTELTEAWDAEGVKRNADIGSDRGYGITLKPHKNPNKHKHMLMTRSTGGKIKVAFDFGKNPENVFVGTPEEVADHINKVLGLTEGFEISESAKAIHKKLMQKGRVSPIDTDRYPKRKGIEGPFRSRKTGKVFYYDPKEGKYYDPNSDMYLDVDDVMEETLNEKLKASDGLGAWIKDFMKSDAPQFKGKSDEEKRDMAIAAFTDAGGKLDEAKGILSVKPNSSEWRTAKLNTDKNIEGAKGVTKLKKGDTVDIHPFDGDRYVGAVDKSNQGTYFFLAKYSVNESVQEDEFELSEGNMDKLVKQLRSAYDKIDTIDPSQPTYDKLIKLLDSLNKEQLKVLVNAKIKFISKLAFTRLNKAMSGNRNAPLPKHTRLGEQMSDKDMVDAVNKMSKDELKKLMRDKKNPMAKLAFRRFNRMQNPRKYPSDQLDENVLVKRGTKFQAGVPKWFGVVMRGLPKYPEQPVAGWKTELETGSGMPGYKSYLLHNDGLGTWTVFADADNVGNRPRMSSKGPLGSFKSPEEAMKFVEKAVLKEGKNDSEVTFELPNGGKAIDFGRWATYVHKSAEEYDKLSGSTVRLVGITKDKRKRAEIEAKLEEMGGFIKSTNSLTDEYTWDETRGAYVRTDGEEGPMEVPVLIDKGNPVADEVPFVNKYANTGEKNARKALGESSMTDDQVAERELALFITNDAQTYKQRIVPIVKNLARKMSSAGGDYDQNLAIKAFIYAVDHGMKRYKDEFGSVIKLDKAAKMNLAEYLLDFYMEDILDLMMR